MFSITLKKSVSKKNSHTCFARHGNGNRNNYKQFGSKYDEDNGYLIFQSKDMKISIDLQDVHEAYECCSGITNDNMKETCYLQFGVDGKMAEKYFKKMKSMEDLYYKQWAYKSYDENTKDNKKKNGKGMFRKWFKFDKEIDE